MDAIKVWMLDDEWPDHDFEDRFFAHHHVSFRATRQDTLANDIERFGPTVEVLMLQVGSLIPAQDWDRLAHIRGIVVPGVGYDHVNLDWARSRQIPVCHVPDYCIEEVSDHVLAIILYYHKDLGTMHHDVTRGVWQPLRYLGNQRAAQQVVGLVGFGRIAQEVARKARYLGFRVMAYDPFASKDVMRDMEVQSAGLDEVVSQCNYLSIHAPKSPATNGLISASLLERLRPQAVVINTARASVVDQDALWTLLSQGKIRGAGLDVFDPEPLLPHSPWKKLSNVILTPHAAYVTEQAVAELRQRSCEEVLRIIQCHPPQHVVPEGPER